MDIANDSHQQFPKMDDPDETEDTLSFCDLPIYSNPEDWESFSKEHQSDEEYFEFLSEELSGSTTSNASSTTSSQPHNIMFCGKLIPYKQEEPVSKTEGKSSSTKKRGFLLRWRSDPFCRAESGSKSNVSGGRKLSGSNSTRWYLFMFGLARFPVEMDLSDMRRRQSRRIPTAVVQSDGGGEKVGVCRSRGKGLWGMIRLYLGCGSGRRANAVVKASFGCMPRV